MSLLEIYDKLVVANANEPEKFESLRDSIVSTEIERMCNGDSQCIWRAKGIMRKQKLKHMHIKDPIARCNASLGDMWDSFREH